MKKIIALLIIIATLLSLFACGEDDTPVVDNTDDPVIDVPGEDDPGAEIKHTYTEYDFEGFHVYVSPDGSDGFDGLSADKPVKTIQKANKIAKNYLENEENPTDVIISLAAGDYYTPSTVSAISGTEGAKVYYTTRAGKANIIGGSYIDSEFIELCDDEWVLSHVSENVAKALYEIDLTIYSDVLTTVSNKFFSGDYSAVGFYSESEELSISRWPDSDEVSGDCKTLVSPLVNENGNRQDISTFPGYMFFTYVNYTKNGQFKTPTEIENEGGTRELPVNFFLNDPSYEVLKNWDINGEEVYMHDFPCNQWIDDIHRVTFVDSAYTYDNVTYKGYLQGDHGRANNREKDVSLDWNSRGYILNCLEAINKSGEYYISNENEKLYVYLPDGLETLYVSMVKDYIFKVENAQNVYFYNLQFSVSQKNIIYVNGCNGIAFTDCKFSDCQDDGVLVNNCMNTTFDSCEICNIGYRANYITNCCRPTKEALVDAKIVYKNCYVHEVGRRRLVYCGAFTVQNTNDVLITHCTMKGSPHGMVFYGSSTNVVVEYCDISDALTESDDAGLFYCYGEWAYNYGDVIRYNYVHDFGATWAVSLNCVYKDNQSVGISVYGNVFANFAPDNHYGHIAVISTMRGQYVKDNIFYNIGGEGSNGFAAMANNLYDGAVATWWFRNMYGEEIEYDDSKWGQFDQTGFGTTWETNQLATDTTRNWTYQFIKKMRSENYLKEILSKPIIVYSNDEGVILDKNNLKYLKVDGKTFTATSEMFDYLISKGYKPDNCKAPDKVKFTYKNKNVTVTKVYYNFYEKLEGGSYKMTSYTETALKKSASQITLAELFTTENRYLLQYMYKLNHIDKNGAWFGYYVNNLTINVPEDLTYSAMGKADIYGMDTYYDKYYDYDTDDDEFTLVDGDNYSLSFKDLLENLVSGGIIDDIPLLDLKTVGSDLV